ncbi:MAG: TRAP transporter small permease [Desulfosarcinaceae bacterium]
MMRLNIIKRRLDRLVRTVALWGGGSLLLALMALTVVDVVRRYGFNAPIYGARDVAKLMLLCLVALSVAYSARTGGQVAIELFCQRLTPPLRRVLALAVRLLAIPMLGVLTWQLVDSGINASRFGEASLALLLPFAPFYAILALGMGLYALVLMVEVGLLWHKEDLDFDEPALQGKGFHGKGFQGKGLHGKDFHRKGEESH